MFTESEAAEKLKLAPATLRDWRSNKLGPTYIKLGTGKGCPVRYRQSDLEHFIEQGVCDAKA
jgi:hypothetical protein